MALCSIESMNILTFLAATKKVKAAIQFYCSWFFDFSHSQFITEKK